MRMLQTRVPAIFLVFIFILMRFQPFSTVQTDTICMRFRFDLLSRTFSNRTKTHQTVCVFKRKRIIVDGASFCAMVITPTNAYL